MTGDRAVVEAFLHEVVAHLDGDVSSALTPDPVRAGEITAALAGVAAAPERSLTEVVVNGRRVDVTVVAPEREWRVVCSIDEAGVHFATTFERPVTFPGVAGGRAVIVNGPSSAGKSSVMAAVLRRSTTPWIVFDELVFGTVHPPFLIWPDTAPTLQPGFVAGITALARAGNQVITTGGRRSTFTPLLDAVGATLTVGLDCPLDERIRRQQARTDRWGGLTEESDDAHDGWTYDVRFDTTARTADEIADRILALVDGDDPRDA